MIIEKLLQMQYNDTKKKYKLAKEEYRELLKLESERIKQAEANRRQAEKQAKQEQKQRIDHLKKIIKEEEELARQAEKEAEKQATQEKRRKHLLSDLQIETATINHYESQLDYYRYRLLVQTTDKNKLKYSEHIFQIEQRIRKAKAKAEQIENELSGLQ